MEGVTMCVLKTGLYSDKSYNRKGQAEITEILKRIHGSLDVLEVQLKISEVYI